MNSDRLYLDHNAATPADPRVLECFAATERLCPANAASPHAAGRRAKAILDDARARTAAALGVEERQIVFTSGGTESNNLAVAGLGDLERPVLLGAVEHPSVAEPARRRGAVWWTVDAAGAVVVRPPEVPVGCLCLVHAQSEVGTLQPIVVAAALATQLAAPLHVDAAQTLGRAPLDEVLAAADTVALSPHKAGGLRGMGLLVHKPWRSPPIAPLLLGGAQEGGLRPGTSSPALAAATALAIELAVRETGSRSERMRQARRNFVTGLGAIADAVRVLTPPDDRSLANTVMVRFLSVDGRSLLPALDLAGVEASTGSACSTGSPQPPAVLAAMGLDDAASRSCVRFSFGRDDDAAIGSRAAQRVVEVIDRLRKKN